MRARQALLILGCLAGLGSCDSAPFPVEPDLKPSPARLSGDTIIQRVDGGASFNLDEVLGKGTTGAVVSSPLLSVLIEGGDTIVVCNHEGMGSLSTIFEDGTSASYHVWCKGLIKIELAIRKPYPLSVALLSSEHMEVKYIVESNGLIEESTDATGIVIECVREGTGTLWVFFTGIRVEYYPLTCKHDQGSGG